MTLRTRSTNTGVLNGSVTTTNPNGTQTVTPTSDGFQRYKVIDDVVTDNYRARIARGEIIMNPVDMAKEEISASGLGNWLRTRDSNGELYTYDGSVTAYLIGLVGGTNTRKAPNASLSLDEHNRRRHASRFQAISRIDPSPYAFMEDLLEIRETLKFIRNPFGALRKLSVRFRKDVNKARQARTRRLPLNGYDLSRFNRNKLSLPQRPDSIQKIAASTWLEYRFAVRPLVQSAFNLALALKAEHIRPPVRKIARGKSIRIDGSVGSAGSLGSSFKVLFFKQDSIYLGYSSGVIYEVPNPANVTRYHLGLRTSDIPLGLWAIMPYSFMVDRVVDISGMIRGLTNLTNPNVKVLSGWTTYTRYSNREVTATGVIQSGWSSVVTGDTTSHTLGDFTRELWLPVLSDTDPPFNLGGLVDDATKIADGFALIAQRFR